MQALCSVLGSYGVPVANFPMRTLQTMAPCYGTRGRRGLFLRPRTLWLLTVIETGMRFNELTASTVLHEELDIPLLIMLYLQEKVVG